jgi:hypothetical protein
MNRPPRRFSPLLTPFLALLAVQLACSFGGGANLPAPIATRIASPTAAISMPLQPAVPEQRLLNLEYPPRLRAGDAERVILTLAVDAQGNLTPTAEVQGNVTQGQIVTIPNVYETHNVMAEARLDLAGVEVQPSGTVSETLLPGQTVTFYWSIRPADVGHYKGTVWFYLRFIPKDSSPESRQALSAQLIEIDAVAFLGLKATYVRWLGLFGTILSSVLGFPFLEDALKWIWKRVRKGQ